MADSDSDSESESDINKKKLLLREKQRKKFLWRPPLDFACFSCQRSIPHVSASWCQWQKKRVDGKMTYVSGFHVIFLQAKTTNASWKPWKNERIANRETQCLVFRGSTTLLSLGLGHGKGLAGLSDEQREIFMVIHVCDVEIVFCSIVWWAQVNSSKHRPSCLCGLHIEMVVADKTENLAITINPVVTEHLPDFYLTRTSTLVGDVLHEVWIACHIFRLSISFTCKISHFSDERNPFLRIFAK